MRTSIRHVLFGVGEGAKLSRDERHTYVAALLFGFAVAAIVGLLVQSAIWMLAVIEDDYLLLSGFVMATPLVAPSGWNFVQIGACGVGLALAVSCLGPLRVSRPLMLCVSFWHCSQAHANFDRWLATTSARPQRAANEPAVAAGPAEVMSAMQPFFRFGASIGLAITSTLTTALVGAFIMMALIIAVGLALKVHRSGRRRQARAADLAAKAPTRPMVQANAVAAAPGESSTQPVAQQQPRGKRKKSLASDRREAIAALWSRWVREPSAQHQEWRDDRRAAATAARHQAEGEAEDMEEDGGEPPRARLPARLPPLSLQPLKLD